MNSLDIVAAVWIVLACIPFTGMGILALVYIVRVLVFGKHVHLISVARNCSCQKAHTR